MYRKATCEDCQGVYSLICDLEQKELPFADFDRIFREQVEDPRYYCLLAEQEGKLLGVLNLRFENQLHHASRIAEVLEFEIHPSCRKQGIGKAMFAKACDLAKECGCSQIELATNQLRTDAHRFYAREGMHNFHYKFSMPFNGEEVTENIIGR